MLYDLSPTLRPETPVYPGDTPLEVAWVATLEAGASANVSRLTTTPHLGSHVDSPFHTEARGETIADLTLAPYLGPCRVIRVPPVPLLEPRHVDGFDLTHPGRLLLRSESVRDPKVFPERYTALSPELATLFAERGVLLVGMDTPSVDPGDSETLEAHHILFRGGVAILEGLTLEGVPEGLYELIALPLKLAGLDASPVRAILRTLRELDTLSG